MIPGDNISGFDNIFSSATRKNGDASQTSTDDAATVEAYLTVYHPIGDDVLYESNSDSEKVVNTPFPKDSRQS